MTGLLGQSSEMKILIAGLGNPILGDDGFGWVVAEKISGILGTSHPTIKIERLALAGLSLMERMANYDRVILIDSLNTGNNPQGRLAVFSLDSLENFAHGHSGSAHDLSLKQSLAFGRSLNVPLPEDKNIEIVAVEASHCIEFSEVLTQAISAAVPAAVQAVLQLIGLETREFQTQ
jgi:hydrogenase maturation protease